MTKSAHVDGFARKVKSSPAAPPRGGISKPPHSNIRFLFSTQEAPWITVLSLDLAGTDAAAYIRKKPPEEGMDTQEVLSKHQKALVEYAAAHQIHLIEIYPEVVSGESLYARPQMLRLLQDVEEGRYDAVLCMDLDRLSRGRMKDQGIILDTFRESDTLIITPEKVYDLSDDIDEEYAELKTFMSRREYKIINKRLQRGLRQSIQAGCYVANAPMATENGHRPQAHP